MLTPDGILKLYSLPHLCLMVLLIAAVVCGLILVRKKIRDERSLHILLVILGALLLPLLVGTRLSHIGHAIAEGKMVDCFGEARAYSWWMLLPDSFCSLIALITPFLIFTKKYRNNPFLEAVYSLAVLGMLSNIFYPEYIGRMPFLEMRAFGALTYHVLVGFLFLVMLEKGIIVPKIKNWYYTPVALSLILMFGLFELTHLNFAEAYNITHPLVANLVVSSWFFLCVGYVLFDIAIRLIFYKVGKKKEKSKEA